MMENNNPLSRHELEDLCLLEPLWYVTKDSMEETASAEVTSVLISFIIIVPHTQKKLQFQWEYMEGHQRGDEDLAVGKTIDGRTLVVVDRLICVSIGMDV